MPAMNDNLIENLNDKEFWDLEWPMTRELMLEAAMVIWEEINSKTQAYQDSQTTGENIDRFTKALGEYRDDVGTAQLRNDIIQFIEPLHIGWHLSDQQGHLTESYDWDFTPWFVANCIRCTSHGLTLCPQWQAKSRAHGAEFEAAA